MYLFLVNLLAYVCYGADKSKAKQGKRRISERCLIFLAFLGGALGAWVAMRCFRHKTLHLKFRILVPLAFFLWLFPTLDILTVFATQRGTVFFTPLMVRRAVEARSDKDAKHPYNHRHQITQTGLVTAARQFLLSGLASEQSTAWQPSGCALPLMTTLSNRMRSIFE